MTTRPTYDSCLAGFWLGVCTAALVARILQWTEWPWWLVLAPFYTPILGMATFLVVVFTLEARRKL